MKTTNRGEATTERFATALETLIADVKEDRSILGAILCGSLSHDTVWEKSDIDLVLVTIDDRTIDRTFVALHVDGVNIHASLMPRAKFRATVDGADRNSFMHSYLAKGRLLYAHDRTIADLHATLAGIGERDTRLELLRAATSVLPPFYKAHKWFRTRRDWDYTALWILYAATPLARIEVVSRRLLADREVIPQALALNPGVFTTIYSDLLNGAKTERKVRAALTTVDAYLVERAPTLFALVLEHLQDVGEARSATEIEAHFHRTLNIDGVTTACEYLADEELIGKTATPMRLTKRSTVDVPELAFFHTGGSRRDDAATVRVPRR